MRVLIVEDELYLAEAIRDGLRLEAIASDVVGDADATRPGQLRRQKSHMLLLSSVRQTGVSRGSLV